MAGVLVVDDEESICWALARALERERFLPRTASSFEQAEHVLNEYGADVLLLDIRLPGLDGLSGLCRVRARLPQLPCIIMTAHGTLETAVEAVQGGAREYLLKPFSLDHALRAVRAALPTADTASSADPPPTGELLGRSPAMQAVFVQVATLAPLARCVLVTGEPGTGKESVARMLHRHGPNVGGPFVPVETACDADRLASELFGSADRPGLVARASGGTLYLVGMADLPAVLQPKLLRLLERGEWTPGSPPADVRVVASSARPLEMRAELVERLSLFRIDVPPLRERDGDLLVLAEAFARQFGPAGPGLTDEARQLLECRRWPGNVRELRNAIERAAVLARGGLLTADLFADTPIAPARGSGLEVAVRQWAAGALAEGGADLRARLLALVERPLFDVVLAASGGNRWEAARRLGIHRATLRKRLGSDSAEPR